MQDRACGNDAYSATARAQRAKVEDAALTPSARVLAAMESESIPFFMFSLRQAESIRKQLTANPLPPAELERFSQLAQESIAEQRRVEAADERPFGEFLLDYLALPDAT